MGGSSKKVTVGYKYHVGMHMVLCHGPVDKLTHIQVDDRLAWIGTATGGQIAIESPNLFGGEKREGGVYGNVDIAMGYPAQGRNDYLQNKLGNEIPSFRGIVGAILRQVYLGTNPYLKRWSFRGQRIHIRQNGIAQWYDSKSEIPRSTTTYIAEERFASFDSTNPNDITTDSSIPPPNALVLSGIDPVNDTVVVSKQEEPDYTAWNLWGGSVSLPDEGWVNTLTVKDDSSVQFTDSTKYATPEEAYENFEPVELSGSSGYTFYLTDDPISDNLGGMSIKVQVVRQLTEADMNPAHIIRECLTDPDWGMGYQDADIDDSSFMASADTLYDEKMGISILWDRQMPLEDFVSEILKHINGNLYVSRTTGNFVLHLIRNDYSVPGLPVFDETNVLSVGNANRPSIGELVNSVTVNFWDATTGETASVTAQDQALMQSQGSAINTTVQYPGLTNQKIASRVALRDLRSLSTELLSCDINANRDAADLNIGDPFVLNWPDLDINSVVMRVQGIEVGDGKRGQIKVTAVEDVFAMPKSGVISEPEDDLWQDPTDVQPLPADPRIVSEVPYYELVLDQGQQAIDDLLTTDPDAGYLLAVGGRQGSEINALIYTDSGAGFEESETMDFSPYSYLAEDLTPTETKIYLTGSVDLDQVEFGTIAEFGGELVRIDSIGSDSSGDFITAGRGVLDTVPVEHISGSDPKPVIFWGEFLASDGVQYASSENIDVKMLTTAGGAVLSSINAPTDSVTFNSRAVRPYPPGDFRIDDLSYPEDYTPMGSAELSWTHRDRTQQTSGTIFDHTNGDIGPESGVTYRVEADAELVDESIVSNFISENVGSSSSFTALDSSTPAPANTVRVYFRVFAVRDGYDSWQAAQWQINYIQAPSNLSAEYRPFTAPTDLQASLT